MTSDDHTQTAQDVPFRNYGTGHNVVGQCAKCHTRGKCASIRWPANSFNALCDLCRGKVKGKK